LPAADAAASQVEIDTLYELLKAAKLPVIEKSEASLAA